MEKDIQPEGPVKSVRVSDKTFRSTRSRMSDEISCQGAGIVVGIIFLVYQ